MELLMRTSTTHATRLHPESGIAIGPILFVVAILGILAAAIGSGSFTAGTSAETSRTRAAAIVQIGQNLKVGMDRIVGLGTDAASVDLNPANTTAADDLFSPTGGGINPPSVTMANATTDLWYYPKFSVPGLGTSADEIVAILRVSSGTCDFINLRTLGSTTAVDNSTGYALGAWLTNASVTVANWPSVLNAQPAGCVRNTTASHTGYFFYQILAVQ
ncbi:MAG: hypothetical protein EBR40_01075 [Proteobacteria bacterium]|nr:hypothetical protein [Pseudomonadota bacterium]